MNYKLLIMLFLVSVQCINCQNKLNMEELAEEEYKYVTVYQEQPWYRLQVSKQGCRVVVVGETQDYRFVDNIGESSMIPYNYMITKSGEQRIKIKVYPRMGDKYITRYAHVSVSLYYAPDSQTGLRDHKKIGTFVLPEGLEEKELPYYEGEIVFNAKVPYDYSMALAKAKNLKEINNIKKKVREKYLEIQEIAKDNNEEKYIKEFLFSYGKTSNTGYQTLEQLKSVYKDGSPFITPSPRALNKEFIPLDNCDLTFYADGKVVALWHKESLKSGLDMKFNYEKEDGSLGEASNADPLFLWMPEGSDELKVW